MLFTEDFLHYIWKFRLFEHAGLQTTDGEALQILSPGMHNTHAGPDFSNARVKIGNTVWAGNVEIHISSADWHKHQHTNDGAYNNVILHVTYRNDEAIVLPDGRKLPTLLLDGRIAEDLHNRYHRLIYGKQQFIPCEGSINAVAGITLQNWLTRTLVQRLENKAQAVLAKLDYNRGDWEETFYQHLAATFGFKVNALPFELLARSLPQQILGKHKNNVMQVEALLFGQAGFLDEEFTDAYPNQLKTEYGFLRKKFQLIPIEKHLWKFMRLRPQNFPTVRLAQFSALIAQSSHLFSKILETKEIDALRKLFGNIHVNSYWDNHYRFDVLSKPGEKRLGKASVDLLLLNTVAVIMFSYGSRQKQQLYIDRSLQLLEDLPVEDNHIVAGFNAIGIKTKTAFESQALLELKNSYCNHKRCLECGVGNQILNLT